MIILTFLYMEVLNKEWIRFTRNAYSLVQILEMRLNNAKEEMRHAASLLYNSWHK